MKKILTGVLMVVFMSVVAGCGPDPTKDIEAAKTALERAKTVEAPVYASSEYKQASDDYDAANKFVENKKNKEAVEKAKVSKEEADKSYDIAVTKRADDVYKKCQDKLKDIDEKEGSKIDTERYPQAETDMSTLTTIYNSKDYMGTYSNGTVLLTNLRIIYGYVTGEIFKAENHVAEAQDTNEQAKNNSLLVEHASAQLTIAQDYLDKAVEALGTKDLDNAHTNADLAIEACVQAYNIANEAAKAPVIDPDKDHGKEQAESLIKEAKDKLDKIKEKLKALEKKTGFLKIRTEKFALNKGDFVLIGKPLEIIDETNDDLIDDEPDVIDAEKEEVPTQELVEKYIKMADEAYEKEEYLDAQAYARRAIQIADQLLAEQVDKTYTVILNPADRDCLWKISGKMYENRTWMWPIIWRANKFQIVDPDLIYPDQKLKIPPALDK